MGKGRVMWSLGEQRDLELLIDVLFSKCILLPGVCFRRRVRRFFFSLFFVLLFFLSGVSGFVLRVFFVYIIPGL